MPAKNLKIISKPCLESGNKPTRKPKEAALSESESIVILIYYHFVLLQSYEFLGYFFENLSFEIDDHVQLLAKGGIFSTIPHAQSL